jgi:cellulose synthase (UDP-forming)
VSGAQGSEQQRISQAAWLFLILALALLLGAIVLATADTGWLGAQQLNPLSLRQLPRSFQVVNVWRDALPPLLLAGGAIVATLWLPRRPWSYLLIQLVLLGVALRYFLWRTTTLNTAHPLSLACSGLLLGTEILYLLTSGLQLVPSLRFDAGLRSRQADQLQDWVNVNQPSVDVWIPTYNEPLRLVRRAILTCRNLDYTNLTISVLDDGHRPAIAALASELGVNYLSREGNAHRKAGNLNAALQRTSAEFIAVFDCDFMPFRGFLQRCMGFFLDPQVALVQTPQHYFQAEFHNRNLGLDVVMPSDLDYFFRYLQVIRDRSNAVICCGTSYVVRRRALERIGGYVTSCLIEDHQTSTKLLTDGWTIRYLNEVLSMGEVPRTFADYLDQRLRWLQGNIQIFFRPRELPIWRRLNREQQAFYVNLAVSMLTPLWRLIYLILPLLSLILGFTLIAAPPIEYLAYGVPFVLLLHTLPSWLSHYHAFQFWNEVYETLFCVPGLTRIVQVLRHPFRIHGGIVTKKEAQSSRQRLNLALSWPLALLLGLVAVTVLVRYLLPLRLGDWAGWRPVYEGESLMLGWNVYNGLVLAVALIACIDQPIRRATDRFPLRRIGRLTIDGRQFWGTTVDFSEEGAAFQLQQPCSEIGPGGAARLELMEPSLSLQASVVRTSPTRLALCFESRDAATESALLALIYSEENWFHRPKRLRTSDALLQALSALFRADPILRRFDGR